MSPKLINAINEAVDWLCDAPEGTDQHERGATLRDALSDTLASDMLRKRKRNPTLQSTLTTKPKD